MAIGTPSVVGDWQGPACVSHRGLMISHFLEARYNSWRVRTVIGINRRLRKGGPLSFPLPAATNTFPADDKNNADVLAGNNACVNFIEARSEELRRSTVLLADDRDRGAI